MTDAAQLIFKAREAAQSSLHPTNKIGAALLTADGEIYTACNEIPSALTALIQITEKIEGSSPTIHAETGALIKALLASKATQGGAVAITDPCCPNCAKNLIEGGITTIYIDDAGFYNDFAERRIEDFNALSIPLCKAAGVCVLRITPETGAEIILSEGRTAPQPIIGLYNIKRNIKSDSAAQLFTQYAQQLDTASGIYTKHAGAVLAIPQADGTITALSAKTGIVAGLKDLPHNSEKYDPVMRAETRVLMAACALGLPIAGAALYTSHTPVPRCLLHMLGLNITHLVITMAHTHSDTLKLFQNAGLKIKFAE